MIAAVVALLTLTATRGVRAAERPPALEWRLARTTDGIVAWAAEGPEEFWGFARGTVAAPADAILARITNFELLPQLSSRLRDVRVLERGDDTALVYFHYDLPWPLSDRSYTVWHHWGRDASGVLFLDVDDANDRGPPPDGTVRVRDFLVRIRLWPTPDGGTTLVEYLFRADLAGYLPRTVRAQTAWKIPLNAVLSMRRSLEPRYASR